MKLCDGGSSYSKIYDTDSCDLTIVPTREIVKDRARFFDYATGHSSKSSCDVYVNELISLAEGSLELVTDRDFTVLDIGSRDMKFVHFRDREAVNMDWNNSCGGNMGFTLEVLGNSYEIDYSKLQSARDSIPVTCGLLGVEKVFDQINHGHSPELAIARFLRGLAKVSHVFCGSPGHLYLSGGLSSNSCFVETLGSICDVDLLGRDVLIHGLIGKARKDGRIGQAISSNSSVEKGFK